MPNRARPAIRRTGMDVQVDDTGRSRARKRPARRLSAYHKKRLRNAVLTASVLVVCALFSAFGGERMLTASDPAQEAVPSGIPAQEATPTPETAVAFAGTSDPLVYVWLPQSGSRYHERPDCSGMQNARQATLEEARQEGFTPCKRCNPPE